MVQSLLDIPVEKLEAAPSVSGRLDFNRYPPSMYSPDSLPKKTILFPATSEDRRQRALPKITHLIKTGVISVDAMMKSMFFRRGCFENPHVGRHGNLNIALEANEAEGAEVYLGYSFKGKRYQIEYSDSPNHRAIVPRRFEQPHLDKHLNSEEMKICFRADPKAVLENISRATGYASNTNNVSLASTQTFIHQQFLEKPGLLAPALEWATQIQQTHLHPKSRNNYFGKASALASVVAANAVAVIDQFWDHSSSRMSGSEACAACDVDFESIKRDFEYGSPSYPVWQEHSRELHKVLNAMLYGHSPESAYPEFPQEEPALATSGKSQRTLFD